MLVNGDILNFNHLLAPTEIDGPDVVWLIEMINTSSGIQYTALAQQ